MAQKNSPFNLNMKTFGNELSQGMYGNYMAQGLGNVAQGNAGQGLVNMGLGLLAKSNPYVAGAMTIAQLLKRKKKPEVSGAQNLSELNRANAATNYENQMSRMASGAAADAAAFKEQQNAYRNEIRNIRERGIAARELGGYLGGTAAQTSAAGQAAMANLRANMARRGMTPSSGVYAGAETALAGQLAGQQGAAIGALNRAAMDRAMMQQAQIFGTDVQQGEAALGRQASLLGAGAELAQRQQAFELQQLANQQARDQAMYQRRFGESQALGQGLMGAYGLYLQNQRSSQADRTTAESRMREIGSPAPRNLGISPTSLSGLTVSAGPSTARLVGSPGNLSGLADTPPDVNFNEAFQLGFPTIEAILDQKWQSANYREPKDGDTLPYMGQTFVRIGGRWVS